MTFSRFCTFTSNERTLKIAQSMLMLKEFTFFVKVWKMKLQCVISTSLKLLRSSISPPFGWMKFSNWRNKTQAPFFQCLLVNDLATHYYAYRNLWRLVHLFHCMQTFRSNVSLLWVPKNVLTMTRAQSDIRFENLIVSCLNNVLRLYSYRNI